MSLKNWKELPIGGIIDEGGTAEKYNTGGWRTYKPVWDSSRCVHCLMCWMHCPDSAIIAEDGKIKEYKFEHCKGCGICAKICPKKCIEMVKE